jgi:hypothetical protein
MKPKLFIGSSVEGLPIAYAIQENLEHDPVDVTVWNQGFFHLSQSTLSELIKGLSKFDLCAFVLTPDDITIIRSQELASARDNIIFELGLFFGALGQDRAYYVIPRSEKNFRLPTDLLGIAAGTYDDKRTDGNLTASLGTFSNQIRNMVWRLEIRSSISQQEEQKEILPSIQPIDSPEIKDHPDFYSFYEERFLPVFRDQVSTTGDKFMQVLNEKSNALDHIVRANIDPASYEENMNSAFAHIYGATLDCAKILVIYRMNLFNEHFDQDKTYLKLKKRKSSQINRSDYIKPLVEAQDVIKLARQKEMSSNGSLTLNVLDAYLEAVAAVDKLLREVASST